MTKPIEDSTNAAAIRTALDVPTTADLSAVDDAAQAAAAAAAAKYTKPSTGIPASDLAAAAQTSLGKADSAIQDLAGMTAKFNAGTAPEKAAFQSSVSGGRLVLAASGSIAAPVATISAATAGSFVLPAKAIPAGLMVPGKSSISGTVLVRRVGANGTAILTVTIGPNDSASDASLYSSTMAATTNNDLRAQPEGFVAEATRISTPVWLTPGASGASATLDRTSGFSSSAPQFIGVRLASANAADVFHLIAYRLIIETAA